MPAETVVFTYNGSDTATATITGATPGVNYELTCFDPTSSPDEETAVATTIVLTVPDIGGGSPGDRFRLEVRKFVAEYIRIGATVCSFGSEGETAFACTWDYDGTQVVAATFVGDVAVTDYDIEIADSTGGSSMTPEAGTGASQTLTNDPGVPQSDDYFEARLYSDTDTSDRPFAVRLFTAGVAGAGFPGNPQPPPPLVPIIKRKRFLSSKISQALTIKFVQNGPSDVTEIHLVELAARPLDPAEAQSTNES